MNDYNDKLDKLSVSDEDYDEYEEEMTERDEYVDEEPYDEEGYAEDEYADEGYEDEYADEGYDEEAYPEEYNDDGYDDKLTQVLNELAELKRGINPPSVVSQPVYTHPQATSVPYIYTNNVPQGNMGNDVVMYNEISRLRDELGRTQNSQSLHVELSKLKEDMEKESKHSESAFLAEIKRLNEKVESLQQKPVEKPVSYNIDGNVANIDLEKLIGINEAILQNAKMADAKLTSEISALKQQIAHLPNFDELNKAIQSIRKSLKTMEETPVKDKNADVLMAEIHEIKKNLNNAAGGIASTAGAAVNYDEKFQGLAQLIQNKNTDNSEILKYIYEIKSAVGSDSSQINRRNNILLSLFNELAKVKFDVKSPSLSYGEKFNSIDAFAVKLASVQEANLDTIVASLEEIASEFFGAEVDKNNFDSLASIALGSRSLSIAASIKEKTVSFLKLCAKAADCDAGEIMDFLPDIIALKNDIQQDKKVTENEERFSEIMNINADILFATEDDKIAALTEDVKNAIKKLSVLKMNEIVTYNMPRPQRVFKNTVRSDEKTVVDKLNEISGKISELTAADAQKGKADITGEITSLRNDLAGLTDISAIEASVNELKEQYIDILTRLTDISQQQTLSTLINKEEDGEQQFSNNELSTQMHDIRDEIVQIVRDENSLSQETTELKLQEYLNTDEENQQKARLADDLLYIKDKLDQQEIFVTQIAELRTDVLNLAAQDTEPQFSKLFNDIVAQIDKLYDDLTAVFNVNDDRYTTLFGEIKSSVDILAANVDTKELTGATQGIREELDRISEAMLANNNEAADARNRLLDDVAFIRSQIEAEQISEAENAEQLAEEAAVVDNNTVYSEILDFRTQINDDIAALRERVDTVGQLADKEEVRAANEMILHSLDDIKTYINDTMLTTVADKETFVGIDKYTQDVQSIFAGLDDVKTTVYSIQDELTSEQQEEGDKIFDEIDEKISAVKDTLDVLLTTQADNVTLAEIDEIKQNNVDLQEAVKATSAKLDELKSTAADNVSRLINELADVKEQIHLKELEANLTTYSANEDDQKTLLKEIAEMRERLTGLEDVARQQSDTMVAQVGLIGDQIEELKASFAGDSDAANIISSLDEIKETLQLTVSGIDAKTTDKMLDDLSYIRSQIENNLSDDDDVLGEALGSEDMSMIMEDLSAIKDKLSALEEYDMVTEILSLREDIKAARIVEQNDVTSELEGLKNDITSLREDVSQIKTLRDDISGYRDEVLTVSKTVSHSDIAPTNDEVNMLLSEIVSLRDEVQAYKDDLSGFITTMKEDSEAEEAVAEVVPDENFTIVLDELTNLRTQIQEYKEDSASKQIDSSSLINNEINDLKENISELKDIISRRTSIVEKNAETVQSSTSEELNIVLDEIINLKDEINDLKSDVYEKQEQERATLLAEIGAVKELLSRPEIEGEAEDKTLRLSEDIESLRQELHDTIGSITPAISEDLTILKNQLADLQINLALGTVSAEKAEDSNSGAEFMAEIRDLKALLTDSIQNARPAPVFDSSVLDELKNEISELKEQLAQKDEYAEQAVMGEVLALREEIASLKSELGKSVSVNSEAYRTDDAFVAELGLLREELGAFKTAALENVPAANDTEFNVLSEVIALHDELEEIKQTISAPAAKTAELDNTEIIDSIEAIKNDIRIIKDEPDLSVISEVMALRDEFQAFKDEISAKQKAEVQKPDDDESAKQLLGEVQTLRDQLFAISMANINDGNSSEVVYESYNNIILDEITTLRDEIGSIRNNASVSSLTEEIAQIKDTITNLAVDERETLVAKLEAVKNEVEAIKQRESSDATNNAILLALDSLKTELENQREADATTLNFMSEMAHLLERQNQYINQSSSSKLSNEIESLKAEIASSLSTSPALETSAIMREISKLKDELSQSMGEAVQIDNQAILDELIKLKEELSRENPSKENTLVLEEISRLKDELKQVTDNENLSSGKDFSKSIHDLKTELNQIATFVNDDEAPKFKQTAAKSKTGAKTGKTGAKATSKTVSGKAAPKKKTETATLSKPIEARETELAERGLNTDELLSKIDAASIEIPRSDSAEDDYNGLTFGAGEGKTDDLDIASKLAKQVANKLIMEQLVQQLGDGGVPRKQVEEIVKDILPQEFTTVQMDEQSDQVRRLANSMVLDKLRARLSGKK